MRMHVVRLITIASYVSYMAQQSHTDDDGGEVELETGMGVHLGPWKTRISVINDESSSVEVMGPIGGVIGNTVVLTQEYAAEHLID